MPHHDVNASPATCPEPCGESYPGHDRRPIATVARQVGPSEHLSGNSCDVSEMFVEELEAFKAARLAPIVVAQTGDPVETTDLLRVALANEINVSELAALWMPTTPELDVKLAFARQAGDEAGHFMLVADRLAALGFDASGFAPATTPMFDFLRGLTTTVERVAASLFTLESIAYGVNEN